MHQVEHQNKQKLGVAPLLDQEFDLIYSLTYNSISRKEVWSSRSVVMIFWYYNLVHFFCPILAQCGGAIDGLNFYLFDHLCQSFLFLFFFLLLCFILEFLEFLEPFIYSRLQPFRTLTRLLSAIRFGITHTACLVSAMMIMIIVKSICF